MANILLTKYFQKVHKKYIRHWSTIDLLSVWSKLPSWQLTPEYYSSKGFFHLNVRPWSHCLSDKDQNSPLIIQSTNTGPVKIRKFHLGSWDTVAHMAAGPIPFLDMFQSSDLFANSRMKCKTGEPVARPWGQPLSRCSE